MKIAVKWMIWRIRDLEFIYHVFFQYEKITSRDVFNYQSKDVENILEEISTSIR